MTPEQIAVDAAEHAKLLAKCRALSRPDRCGSAGIHLTAQQSRNLDKRDAAAWTRELRPDLCRTRLPDKNQRLNTGLRFMEISGDDTRIAMRGGRHRYLKTG